MDFFHSDVQWQPRYIHIGIVLQIEPFAGLWRCLALQTDSRRTGLHTDSRRAGLHTDSKRMGRGC